MKPLKNLVVAKKVAEEEKKVSGLFLAPPKWAKPSNIVEVIDVGPEVNTVETGKRYYINPYAVIDTEDKDIKIIRESDFLCQIESQER